MPAQVLSRLQAFTSQPQQLMAAIAGGLASVYMDTGTVALDSAAGIAGLAGIAGAVLLDMILDNSGVAMLSDLDSDPSSMQMTAESFIGGYLGAMGQRRLLPV